MLQIDIVKITLIPHKCARDRSCEVVRRLTTRLLARSRYSSVEGFDLILRSVMINTKRVPCFKIGKLFQVTTGKSAILFAVPRLPLAYRVGEYNGTCVYSQQIARGCFVPIVFWFTSARQSDFGFFVDNFVSMKIQTRGSRQNARFIETKPEEELEHIGHARFIIFFRNIYMCVRACVCLCIFECTCLFSYKTYD